MFKELGYTIVQLFESKRNKAKKPDDNVVDFSNTIRGRTNYPGLLESERSRAIKSELISDIPAIIVDPHNLVLSSWVELPKPCPAMVLHIDNHHDMWQSWIPIAEYQDRDGKIDFRRFAEAVGIGGFICPAIHEKAVGAVYWYNPRDPGIIKAYGRAINGHFIDTPETKIEDNGTYGKRITWSSLDDRLPEILSIDQFYKDMRGSVGLPLILDIDLDAFSDIYDDNIYDPNTRMLQDAMLRMNFAMNLVSQAQKPNLITIARSETPHRFTPTVLADTLQENTIQRLTTLYKKSS